MIVERRSVEGRICISLTFLYETIVEHDQTKSDLEMTKAKVAGSKNMAVEFGKSHILTAGRPDEQ